MDDKAAQALNANSLNQSWTGAIGALQQIQTSGFMQQVDPVTAAKQAYDQALSALKNADAQLELAKANRGKAATTLDDARLAYVKAHNEHLKRDPYNPEVSNSVLISGSTSSVVTFG